MEKKTTVLISLAIIIVGSVSFLIYNSNSTLSPNELEECKILQDNGENKISILFFSDKENAQKYSDSLLNIPPLSENKDNFNLYYIDTYKPKCELYQEKALLCYDKETVKKASSCPNDLIITVIEKEDKKIRSSAYMNFMSINSRNTLTVIAHEFGHVFASLADEYVPSVLPKKSKNCVTNCNKFDIKDGCFLGCSKEDYYRSIDNGLMRTLSASDFGIFDEKVIIEKITETIWSSSGITGNVIENIDCSDQEYILIHGQYSGQGISIKDKSIEHGCLGDFGSGDLGYTLNKKDGSEIQREFNPGYIFTDLQDESGNQIEGEVFVSNQDFFLKIPVENTKSIKISKEDQTLKEINLEDLANKARPCLK
ncbi:MAG: hypothetical protein ABIB79_00570 [archaeon]